MEKLVAHIARNFQRRLPTSIAFDDLYQEGVIGWLKAEKSYKPAGCKYSTYVGFKIKRAIQDYLRAQDPLSRSERKRQNWLPYLPEESYESDYDYAGMSDRLRAALETLPIRERQIIERLYFAGDTSVEVAKTLGVDGSRITHLHQRALGRLRDALGRL